MRRRNITLSERELEILTDLRHHHPRYQVRARAAVLLEAHKGKTGEQIAMDVGCHPNTVLNIIKRYRRRGLQGALSLDRRGRRRGEEPDNPLADAQGMPARAG